MVLGLWVVGVVLDLSALWTTDKCWPFIGVSVSGLAAAMTVIKDNQRTRAVMRTLMAERLTAVRDFGRDR